MRTEISFCRPLGIDTKTLFTHVWDVSPGRSRRRTEGRLVTNTISPIHFVIPGTISICLYRSHFGNRKCVCSQWTSLCLVFLLSPSGKSGVFNPWRLGRSQVGNLWIFLLRKNKTEQYVVSFCNWCTKTDLFWFSKRSI